MESDANGRRFKIVWDEGDERHIEKGTLVGDKDGFVQIALYDGRLLYLKKTAIVKMLEVSE
jgi:hypothetical protein